MFYILKGLGGRATLGRFIVDGGAHLKGEVRINGAKNAALAIIPATLLSKKPCVISNLPNISDVDLSFQILKTMGAKIEKQDEHCVMIDTSTVHKTEVPFELAMKMRASYYYLGALLARFKEANVAMPGGCNFGVRPINLHLKGFESLGANYEIDGGIIRLRTKNLTGAKIYFDVVSVGATINILLAATTADGVTIIENAAKEPHIVDLANFLNSIGANIIGAGTNIIKIKGVKELNSSDYTIIPDQIEAGSYMAMAAVTRGDVLIKDVTPKHLESIVNKMESIGLKIKKYDSSLHVFSDGNLERADVTSQAYPGFPTDMQPQITAVLTFAKGTSIVTEGIWDNRFQYVGELCRMGAAITVDGKVAVVEGGRILKAAPVEACDLRAGAALIVAALGAKGQTEIKNTRYIERGYEDIVGKLTALGANIKKV